MRTQGAKHVCRTSAAGTRGVTAAPNEGGRTTPLRVDAQRNLEHVLRAAREVFGEVGYGAPMEDVARRAKVGVGTVYRRFPSKEVLVKRIAAQETARLTEQARQALEYPGGPWEALSSFLRSSVASGAGRLLPPRILRVGQEPQAWPPPGVAHAAAGPIAGRATADEDAPSATGAGDAAVDTTGAAEANADDSGHDSGHGSGHGSGDDSGGDPALPRPRRGNGEDAVPRDGSASAADGVGAASVEPAESDDAGAAELLSVVGRLVDRARQAGELRADVSVADVLLVIATAAPALPDAGQQSAASERLLDILLAGLRSRHGG